MAAFFDLDKTVIARSSALAFSRPFAKVGLMTRRSVLRSAYAQFVFLASGADHEQMDRIRLYMSSLVEGWDVATVRSVVEETLHTIVEPIVYDEAMQLIHDHQADGHDIVIVSSSGEEVVAPIGRLVGADRVVATRLEVKDGRYTGGFEYYAYGPVKAEVIRELAESEGYDLAQCYAYTDSITDLPMLEAVGHPFAVNPDKGLRREASQRGWPVLVFDRPVAVHPGRLRHRLTARSTLVAVGLTGLAVGAAIIFLAGRRSGTARPA